MLLLKILKVLKWTYIVISEVVGWAGIPDDVKTWGKWSEGHMEQVLGFLDLYPTRVFLVLKDLI